MPLTYALQLEGLTLPVLVGLNHQETVSLVAAGRPILAPRLVTGLIDTGTDVTAVSRSVIHSLGLVSSGQGKTTTASGSLSAFFFEVSLGLPLLGPPPGSLLLASQLTVMELTQVIPKVDVLIGLDVLLAGRLLLDGPARQFTLDY